MWHKLPQWKWLLTAGAGIVAVLVAGCGAAEREATPVPTATSAPAAAPTATSAPAAPSPTAAVATQPPAGPTATPTQAPQPTPTPPPVAQRTGGKLVAAFERIGAPSFVPQLRPYPTGLNLWSWGILECLSGSSTEGFIPTPWLARSWELNGLNVDISLNRGIPWHDNWGEFTAHDVKFTQDSARAEGSIETSIAHFQFIEDIEVVDDYTVRFKYKTPFAFWDSDISVANGCRPISSKAVADKLGLEQANITPVGTGPFRVVSWASGESMRAEAVVPHWFHTPSVDELEVLEVPEAASRVAMVLTGEAHISDVPFQDIPRIRDSGGQTYGIGIGTHQLIAFAGNYWLKQDHEGKPLAPRDGFNPNLPWIGDPDNPESMERARKVRWAMSLALDRQKIADTVLIGLGRPEHEPYGGFGTPDRPLPDEFVVPYDPARAKQLLAEAGYPGGFSLPFWMPEGVARIDLNVVESYFSFWEAVGIKVEARRTAYTAGRPDLVSRKLSDVWAWGREAPYRADSAQDASASTYSAFTLGFENQTAADLYARGQNELDPLKRIAIHEEYTKYNHEQALLVSSVWAPKLFVAGKDVQSWQPWIIRTAWPSRFDTVVLNR